MSEKMEVSIPKIPRAWNLDSAIHPEFKTKVDSIILTDTEPILVDGTAFYKGNEIRGREFTLDRYKLYAEHTHEILLRNDDVEAEYYISAGVLALYGKPVVDDLEAHSSIMAFLYPKDIYRHIHPDCPVFPDTHEVSVIIDKFCFELTHSIKDTYCVIDETQFMTSYRTMMVESPHTDAEYQAANRTVIVGRQMIPTEHQLNFEKTYRKVFMLFCEYANLTFRSRIHSAVRQESVECATNWESL